MALLQFNAYDYDPSQGSAICFPLADYKIEITDVKQEIVKNNPAAAYLELSLTILEGDCRGMIQKDRLNIYHTSEIAKRIAHQQLSAYCFAIGRPFVQNTEDLIGGRCICTIGPQDGSDKYSDVKAVKCMDGTLPTKQTPVAPVQTMAPPMPPQQPQQPQQPQAVATGNQAGPALVPAQTSTTTPAPPWANSGVTVPVAAPGTVPPWAK